MKKLAIITGASSGIGKQTAIDLAEKDYFCILMGRNESRLNETKKIILNSEVLVSDFMDKNSILKSAEKINEFITNYDKIVLINNAGMVERQKFLDSNIKTWEVQFQVNLLGPVLLTQLLLDSLIKAQEARIINVTSSLGVRPIDSTSAYSASKSAMNSWTQSLALELAEHKIPVNAIAPGIVETPIHEFYNTKDSKLRAELSQLQPMKRMGSVKDISETLVFLAESKTNWMTGVILPVDGGILLGS